MKNIIVIGDIILDKYINCSSVKINSECPNIVFKNNSENYKLGGATNVAKLLSNFGNNVFFISTINDSIYSKIILELFNDINLSHNYLYKNDKKISLKTRFYNKNNQLFRIDDEDISEINNTEKENIIKIFIDIINNNKIDCILISDYNKGLCSELLLKEIIKISNNNNINIFVDPKIKNIIKYKGCTCLKPNRIEYQEICKNLSLDYNFNINTLENISNYLNLKYLIVTLDTDGLILFNNITKEYNKFNVEKINNVIDVTGAGDTFISVLVHYYSQYININKIMEYCNKICLYSITQIGNANLHKNDLDSILDIKEKYYYEKMNINNFKRNLKNKKIVFTNGCFDILHKGHIKYLKECKKMGDILIIGLNSDESVKKLKGNNRPINNEEDRSFMLLSYIFIDYIIIFNEDTPYNLIKDLGPDYLVKGGDYNINDIVGKEFAKEVRVIDYLENYSTTNIINKIMN